VEICECGNVEMEEPVNTKVSSPQMKSGNYECGNVEMEEPVNTKVSPQMKSGNYERGNEGRL
jgi:hypothetical protein